MLASTIFASGLTLTARPGSVARVGRLSMAIEKLPGEGDPFSSLCPTVDAYGDTATAAKRGDVGLARWHADSGYIEDDDEPWHSTCVSSTALAKDMADGAFTSALPFIAPEEALVLALSKVKSAKDVDEAVAACLAAGGRPGCPAIMDAEKIKKSEKDGAVKAGKAPKVAAQGKGWDDMARALGKVHDNSV